MFISWGSNSYVHNPDYAQSAPVPLPFNDDIFPVFIGSTARVFSPTILITGADMQLFIAGQPVQWRESSLSIDLILGAKGKCTFTLFSTTTYRPNVFDEVIFYRKGVRRFGGLVQTVVDSLIPGVDAHEMVVTCTDYMGYLDRVIVAKLYTIPIGGFGWIIIFDLIQVYLKQFGITFAGFANSGAFVGEVLFHYVTLAQAIAQIVSAAPSVYFWIDAYKIAHYSPAGNGAPAGFGAAPYSISDTSRNYFDFQVSVDGTLYRNKQWVLPSANVLSLRVETFTGDGSTTGFFTLYVLSTPPVVSVNGNNQTVATLGGSYPAGWSWYFIPGGQGVFQRPGNTPLGVTDTLSVAYPSPFALAISVENDTEIALHGLVEAVIQPQNVIDLVTAEAMASGLLAAYCPNAPQTIVYTANEMDPTGQYAAGESGRWLIPGMTVPITKTIPAASGTATVQEVVSQEYGLSEFVHTVTVQLNTGNLNPQLGMLTLSQGALAATNNNATETAGVKLGQTIQGVTNPGLATGDSGEFYIFLYDGVLSYWSISFPNDPPTGADIVVDALVNGVSVLPSASAQKIVLSAGNAGEQQGYLFLTNNLAVHKGDRATFNVIQVGSTNPGTNGQVKLVTVR